MYMGLWSITISEDWTKDYRSKSHIMLSSVKKMLSSNVIFKDYIITTHAERCNANFIVIVTQDIECGKYISKNDYHVHS